MPKKTNTHTFMSCDHAYEQAEIILFGAPFDGTTSYRPGTRFASTFIRNESLGIEEYSPYLDKSLEDIKVCDIGDLEFSTNPNTYLPEIKAAVAEIIADDKKPLMIGGEHLVTLGAIEAIQHKYPDLYILHFDAHTDLRQEYLGEELSHATVIYNCWKLLGDHKIFQFGIRSGMREEFLWSKDHTILQKFNTETLEEALAEIGNKPIYLTIDLDVLDPSIFPGTGTPEPGGITFQNLIDCIEKISDFNLVGADLVELAPHYDQSGVSTIVACKVARELMLAMSD